MGTEYTLLITDEFNWNYSNKKKKMLFIILIHQNLEKLLDNFHIG